MQGLVLETQIATLCKNENENEFAIFSSDKKYSIPGYQRPYEWNEDKIKEMMASLFDFYQEGSQSYNNDALLFGTIHLNVNCNNEYEIIDGQQRLVSFYLLIEALKAKCPSITEPVFDVTYYIQDAYNNAFKNANGEKSVSLYATNYRILLNILSDDENTNKINYCDFFNMVVTKVKFVVIITKNVKTIERTLQIFTALNTTGLPLDVKDVFKVKFCDFLSAGEVSSDNTRSNLIIVNDAYARLGKIEHLNEDDLLDVYRFFLLGKVEKRKSEYLKGSNQKFFGDIFDAKDPVIHGNMKADDLVEIAKVIEYTEGYLKQKRCENNQKEDNIHFLARDLMALSGYGRLKNLLYYFVLCQSHFDFKVTDEHIDNACKMMLALSNMCVLYRMNYSKIVNEVFSFVASNILKFDGELSPSVVQNKISAFLNSKDDFIKNYKEIILGKKSLFDNSRVHYFLLLSYAEDCISTGVTLETCYKDVLHREKWDIDIEHIHSQKFYDNSPVSNELLGSLGNLMYLESGINRTLGNDIKGSKVNNSKEDYSKKTTRYKKSKLVSVTRLLKEHSSEEDWTEKMIKDRLSEKQKYINNIFKNIIPEEKLN